MAVKFFNMTRAEFLSKKLLYKYMPLEHALDLLINKRLIKGTFVPFVIPNTSMIEAITIDPNIGVNTVNMLKKIFESDYGFLPRAHNQKRVQRSLLYSANVNDLLKI